MKKLPNGLIAGGLLVVLAVIGIEMNPSQVAAQGPSDGLAVRIVNPLPVPISGTSTVSGTVAATQNGAWTVGIAGQPLSVKSIDQRVPYRETVDRNRVGCGTAVCSYEFVFSTVPANTRLIITDVSVDFIVLSGGNVFAGNLDTALPPVSVFVPFIRQGPYFEPGTDEWVTNQQVNLHIDQGRAPEFFANVDPNHVSNERSQATLTGYYIPAP